MLEEKIVVFRNEAKLYESIDVWDRIHKNFSLLLFNRKQNSNVSETRDVKQTSSEFRNHWDFFLSVGKNKEEKNFFFLH